MVQAILVYRGYDSITPLRFNQTVVERPLHGVHQVDIAQLRIPHIGADAVAHEDKHRTALRIGPYRGTRKAIMAKGGSWSSRQTDALLGMFGVGTVEAQASAAVGRLRSNEEATC